MRMFTTLRLAVWTSTAQANGEFELANDVSSQFFVIHYHTSMCSDFIISTLSAVQVITSPKIENKGTVAKCGYLSVEPRTPDSIASFGILDWK